MSTSVKKTLQEIAVPIAASEDTSTCLIVLKYFLPCGHINYLCVMDGPYNGPSMESFTNFINFDT